MFMPNYEFMHMFEIMTAQRETKLTSGYGAEDGSKWKGMSRIIWVARDDFN